VHPEAEPSDAWLPEPQDLPAVFPLLTDHRPACHKSSADCSNLQSPPLYVSSVRKASPGSQVQRQFHAIPYPSPSDEKDFEINSRFQPQSAPAPAVSSLFPVPDTAASPAGRQQLFFQMTEQR